MSEDIRFSTKNYPEMLEVPLTGDLLREFVRFSRENLTASKLGIADDGSQAAENGKRIEQIVAEVTGKLTHGLDTDGAHKFGIDARDLLGTLRESAGHHPEKVDMASAISAATGGKSTDKGEMDAWTTMVANYMLNYFSICLAVQEGKDKELLDLYRTSQAEGIAHLTRAGEQESDKAYQVVGNLTEALIGDAAKLEELKRRRSPTAPLFEKIHFGRDGKGGSSGLLSHAIATTFGIDTSQEEGRLAVREVRQQAFTEISQMLGVAIPSMPDH